jgi:hypothetical protein
MGSDSRCDIPLREPLDPEYRLNRKLAKQIYNKERLERVQQHKEELNLTAQQKLDLKMKQDKKAEKKKEDLAKMKQKMLEEKYMAEAEKREMAL